MALYRWTDYWVMPRSLDRVDLRRGAVAIINGLSLWFVTVLAHAYSTDEGLPWKSLDEFYATTISFSRGKIAAPGYDELELALYASGALIIFGPIWFWLLVPFLRPRLLPYLQTLPFPSLPAASHSEPTETTTVLGWSSDSKQHRRRTRFGMPPGRETSPVGRPVIEFRRPRIPPGWKSLHIAFQNITDSIRQTSPDQRTQVRLAVIAIAVGMVMATSGAYLVIGGELTANGSDRPSPDSSPLVNETSVERTIFHQVNDIRDRTNRRPLSWNSDLSAIAASHSEDMRLYNYTGHVSPDGSRLSDRLSEANHSCESAAELVLSTYFEEPVVGANGTTTYTTEHDLAMGIVQSWNRSNRHRSVILNESWRSAGVGITTDTANKVYVTMTFCGG